MKTNIRTKRFLLVLAVLFLVIEACYFGLLYVSHKAQAQGQATVEVYLPIAPNRANGGSGPVVTPTHAPTETPRPATPTHAPTETTIAPTATVRALPSPTHRP